MVRLCTGHAAASPPGRRKKTALALVGRAGFARLGYCSGGLAGLPGKFQVSLCSLPIFISLSISVIVFGFNKNARAFPKIIKLIMATA